MSNFDDHDDWSNDAASLFRDARRAHDPTPAETARLDAVRERILARGATTSLTPKPTADVVLPAAKSLVLRKIASVSLGAACIAAASYAFIHFTRHPAEPARSEQPAPAALERAAPPSAAPASAELRASAPPAVTHDEAQPRSRSPRRRTPTATERPRSARIEPAPASEPSDTGTTPIAPQPSAAPHDRSRPASTLQPSAASQAAPQPAHEPEPEPEPQQKLTPPKAPPSELALMKRMQGALRDADFSAAIALCAEHARRWPHGVFELEREGVRAIAACGEEADDAAQRARRFLTAHPQAPVAMRVSAACAAQLQKR